MATDLDDDDEDLFLHTENSDESLNFNVPSYASKYLTTDMLDEFFNFNDHFALNLLHVNCRSLKKNFGPINNLLNSMSNNLSAIAVTETWLTDALHDVYHIPGYKFLGNSRVNKSGGGVGIFIKNCFDYKLRPDLCKMSDCIECLFIEIHRAGKQLIIIGCIYRPPNTDISVFNSEMLIILNKIDQISNKIAIIAGDFNLNLLKHFSHPPTGEFINLLLSFNFLPTICQPTRITDFSATLIDNIFVSCFKMVYNSAIVYSDISDHLPVALHLIASIPKTKLVRNVTRRSFDAKSIEKFNNCLSNTNWNIVYSSLCI